MSAPVRLLIVSDAPDPQMVEAMRDAVWLDRHLDQERSVIAGWLRAGLAVAPSIGREEIARALHGHALSLADRIEQWDNMGEASRETWRQEAAALLASLAARRSPGEQR